MKSNTLLTGLVLAGVLATGLALPATAAADGWRDRGHDRYSWRDHDRHQSRDHYRYRDRDHYRDHRWIRPFPRYHGWYDDYRSYNWDHRRYPHWEPLFYPDGSIRLWVFIDN